MFDSFIWWFDDLSLWKKALFIFKFIAALFALYVVILHKPGVKIDGQNHYSIGNTNFLMSYQDYRQIADDHCRIEGGVVTQWERRRTIENHPRLGMSRYHFKCQ